MKLIFIRHGETDSNINKLLMGQEVDESLNKNGIEQVKNIAKLLPKDIELIFSSPLKRSLQTTDIINRVLGREVVFRDDLKEISYGSLAGKSWEQNEKETGDDMMNEKDTNIEFDYRQYGGESAEEVKTRVARFVEEVKGKHNDKVFIVSTHGGIIDTMYVLFSKANKKEADNASLHEFVF